MKLRNAICSFLLTLGFMTGAFAEPVNIPKSEHVKYLFSAGEKRDYSEVIQENHKRYSEHRGVHYRFFDLNDKQSPVFQELGSKQKYWAKIVILGGALNSPEVPENSWVAWMDDDIGINDINHNTTMMDKVIDKFGKDKSVLVAKEENNWAYLNTGIMLVKKNDSGRKIITTLMGMSDEHIFGYVSQADHSFHEQGALKELYIGKYGVLEKDENGAPLKKHIGLVPQRDEDINFNNFRRKSHRDDAREMDLVYNDSDIAKAKDTDAFIHHTGMAMNLRGNIIRETLAKIDQQTEHALNFTPKSASPFMAFIMEQKQARFKTRRKVGEKIQPTPNKNKAESSIPDFTLVSPRQSDAELKQEQQAARKKAKADLKIPNFTLVSPRQSDAELKQEQQAARKKAKADLKIPNFTLVSPRQSDAELKQEQQAARKQARAEAKLTVRTLQEKQREALEAKEKAKAEALAVAEAKAAEEQRLFNNVILTALKKEAETSLQGLQSMGTASAMMMMTTMSGMSGIMSSYRSGRAFSFGMASIDDTPVSEMLASASPTTRSSVIRRETGSWHNFVQVHMMKGNRNSVNNLPGGSISGQGLSAGVFYQLNPDLVTGMMLSVNKNAMSFDQGDSGKITSISAGPFMSYSLNDWHIDAALTMSHDDYELKRKGITATELKSEFSGTTLTGYLATGYDIHLDHWAQGLTLTPMAEFMLIRSRRGDYREQGNARESVRVKSATNTQMISRLGMEAGYLLSNLEKPTEIKTRFGVQLQNMPAQNGSYQLSTGATGQLRVPAMSERSLFTGLELQRQMGQHSKIAMSYNGTFSANGNSHGLQLEFEKKF